MKDKDELFEKYKKKVLQVLSNIYKTHRDSLLKKYFDKWRKASNLKGEEKEKDILKYKKKPKLTDKNEEKIDNQESNQDTDTFRPTYYIPKTNLYNRVLPLYDNDPDKLFNEKYNPNNPNNLSRTNYKPERRNPEARNYTTIKNRNNPYINKYDQPTLDDEQSYQNPDDLYYDDTQRNNEIPSNNNINIEENYSNDNENDNYNDNESG